MFTAICGGAEVLSPLFLDVIPKYMGQGDTCRHLLFSPVFKLMDLFTGPYFGLGISALVTAIFSYYLPEPLNFHLPSTIEDTLYMQKSKEMVQLIASCKCRL